MSHKYHKFMTNVFTECSKSENESLYWKQDGCHFEYLLNCPLDCIKRGTIYLESEEFVQYEIEYLHNRLLTNFKDDDVEGFCNTCEFIKFERPTMLELFNKISHGYEIIHRKKEKEREQKEKEFQSRREAYWNQKKIDSKRVSI